MGGAKMIKPTNNEPNIYISTGIAASTGACAGCFYESGRQYYLINTTKERADEFITNVGNKDMKKKYTYIRNNINSPNLKKKQNAIRAGNSLLTTTAIAGACLFTAAYLSYTGIKKLVNLTNSSQKKDLNQ